MNISTYEARIAALEAQLGPGPVPETGLVSMVITPDILLTDGTTINEKLNTFLPKESGVENLTFETTADQIPVITTFNVEIVPGSEWYAVNGFDEQHDPTFGEKGAKMKTTLDILTAAQGARRAAATMDADIKHRALLAMAFALEQASGEILEANAKDVAAARGTVSDVMIDRLANYFEPGSEAGFLPSFIYSVENFITSQSSYAA